MSWTQHHSNQRFVQIFHFKFPAFHAFSSNLWADSTRQRTCWTSWYNLLITRCCAVLTLMLVEQLWTDTISGKEWCPSHDEQRRDAITHPTEHTALYCKWPLGRLHVKTRVYFKPLHNVFSFVQAFKKILQHVDHTKHSLILKHWNCSAAYVVYTGWCSSPTLMHWK